MSNFPASLDALDETHPVGSQTLAQAGHSALHRQIHAMLNAIEAKVGVDGSAVTTSHDYKLSGIDGTDVAVGEASINTLTGKTIDGDNNTIQDVALSSLKTMLAQANTFVTRDASGTVISTKAVPTGEVVGTTDGQVQVSPRLDRPAIGDFSLANHNHTSTREGGQLSLDAIVPNYKFLAYRELLTTYATSSTTAVQIPGLSAAIGIPEGGRLLKVTAFSPGVYPGAGYTPVYISIWDGPVGTGTQLQQGVSDPGNSLSAATMANIFVIKPFTAGLHTFNVGLHSGASQANFGTNSGAPGYLLVEQVATFDANVTASIVPFVSQPQITTFRRRLRRALYPTIAPRPLT